MSSPPRQLVGGSPQVEARFVVEATSTRNENLSTDVVAGDAREAKVVAIHEFMGQGHGVLHATVSVIAADGQRS